MNKYSQLKNIFMLLLSVLFLSAANSVTVPPALRAPLGPISDKTPTYKWTTVASATSYQYQLLKGTRFIYAQTVSSSACGASLCTHTPTTELVPGSFRWRVRAMVGGIWQPFSVYKAFALYGPGVKIISKNTYLSTSSSNYRYVVGEVFNTTTAPVWLIKISVNFFNNTQLVATDYTYAHLDNLLPDEKTCFSMFLANPSVWTSYSFEAVTFHTGGTARPNLTVTSSSGSYNAYNYEILGQARNGDTKTVKYGSAVATLYNSAGLPIGCGSGSLNNNNLGVGKTSSFDILAFPSDPANVASYILQTDGS